MDLTWNAKTAAVLREWASQLVPFVLQLLERRHTPKARPRALPIPSDLYRMLGYDATLELLDRQGKHARFAKTEQVEFLHDNVQILEDYAWGGGRVLANYRCAPGVAVDRIRDGERWKVLIALRQIKKRGEKETLYIQRRLVNVFTQREGWWQIVMQHDTARLKLSILFPRARPCQRAVLIERTRNKTIPLKPEGWAELPDGRQVLTWEMEQPRRYETYTFKWHW